MSEAGGRWTEDDREAYRVGLRFVFGVFEGLLGWEKEYLRSREDGGLSSYNQPLYDIYASGGTSADAVSFVRREIGTAGIVGALSEDEVAQLRVHDPDWQADIHKRIGGLHASGASDDEVVALIRREIGAAADAPAP